MIVFTVWKDCRIADALHNVCPAQLANRNETWQARQRKMEEEAEAELEKGNDAKHMKMAIGIFKLITKI